MSLAVVHTRALLGINAPKVTVEAHLSNGLPGFTIVGLPETAVRESKDRVRSALINSHFEFPQRRITINLAPADLPKEGARFDLAIALGILAASEQVPSDVLDNYEFIGELALSGELRYISGCIPSALAVEEAGRSLILPQACVEEAALCQHATIYSAANLLQVCAHLHERESLPTCISHSDWSAAYDVDLNEVKGQTLAKRALELAASGGHNLLFFGPPGTGKSMLASRLPTILPRLQQHEALEVAAIKSVSPQSKRIHGGDYFARPFRSPHHSASSAALVGGGNHPRPGEISLAHHGVLFLDELPEFNRNVLEVLREPMESGEIHLSRANASICYPSKFQMVAAMNPCPCGHYGDGSRRCECTPTQILRYKDKISGPLLDRIDMQVQVDKLPIKSLHTQEINSEASSTIQERVTQSRALQLERQGCPNARLSGTDLHKHCSLEDSAQHTLNSAIEALHLSPRSYDRILRVARTVADTAASANIDETHIAEALGYRNFDRFYSRLSRF